MKKKIKEIEEWNPDNLLTQDKIDSLIENLGHFTFKTTHTNAISGGLIAEKVNLDGYVCMSSIMSGNEYELMHNPAANVKVFKRVNAVNEGKEDSYENVNKNDVLYIKQKLEQIGINQNMNLEVSNKRLKQVIIQETNDNKEVENKELIILRSTGFAKILEKLLEQEKEELSKNNKIRTRQKAQMSFGGAKPLNIGANAYLMSRNVLYFEAPSKQNKNTNFDEAYKIHNSGLKLYDLVTIEFLKQYYTYQQKIDSQLRINSYFSEKEKELIENLFNYIKVTVIQKYKLLEENKGSFVNGKVFSDNLLKSGNEDKLLAFSLIDKSVDKFSEEIFINCLVTILKTKTFYLDKKATNLLLTDTNEFNIKKILREVLWQNI